MSLVERCMKALGKEAVLLSRKEADGVSEQFTHEYPITFWGRIDWTHVAQNWKVDTATDVLQLLRERGKALESVVFLLWDEGTLPVVQSNIHAILQNIEDVTIVSFDTWLFCPAEHYCVEFYHEGEITVGFSD